MSLFKTRDWWSTSVGEEEDFDHGCLCTANVDNDLGGCDKIIIGSFQGILRIYIPNSGNTNVVEDVAVEQAFKQPILQVEVGRFSSAADNLKLAVLHPRKLAVFNVSVISGTVEHGSQYQLTLLYEHILQRTAFNFCYGAFGGIQGKDFLCVQSMDGTVFIFEQESFAFSCFLPGALLPGPIKYISRHDTFVTTSSSWKVEAYRYQVLAVASETGSREETLNIKTGKKVIADWTFNIGEQGLDIAIVEYPDVSTSILILGEHSIFCLSDTGTLRFVNKLEYDPCCILPYASLSEKCINFLVGSHTKSLLVYQDVTLKWMAKMEFVPLQVQVANFKGLRAGIVTLSQSGHLKVMYLGTDPSVFVPPQVESRDINYATLDAEIARLMKHVKSKSANSVITPSLKTEDDLSINVHVSPNLDDISLASEVKLKEEKPVPSVTVRIQMKSRLVLEMVKLEIHCPWPLACNQSDFTLTEINPNMPSETFVAVFQRFSGLPSHMEIQISATYTSAMGGRRVTMTKAQLPARLVLKPVFPVKTAVHKLTIDTNRAAVNLNDIFPDLLGENADGQGAALAFQYVGAGPVVTLLASKTSQRYRLQSDSFESMCLPLQELVARLNSHFKKSDHSDFRITFDGPLPLQEYFELVDTHYNYRCNAHKCKEILAQRASQFRTIQKRLLTRFKDKTPAPLQHLDTLLEGTYRQILALTDAVNENWSAEQMTANNLSSGTSLLNLLLRLWADMTKEEVKVLDSTLSSVVNPSDDQGWEESVDAAITLLLRTVMAKSGKELSVNPSPLTQPEDTSKIKKHIALFCDRIGKGTRLVDGLKDKKEKTVHITTSKTTVETSESMISMEQSDGADILNPKYKFGRKVNKGKVFGLPQQDIQEDDALSSILQVSLHGRGEPSQDLESQHHIESLVPDLDSMSDESTTYFLDESQQ
uniref:PTHB1 N-terminal domain-containing protein n=2 Tax=Arion vulgaris TaxID=1028688 RepID=A0A0B7AJ40_9EUPU